MKPIILYWKWEIYFVLLILLLEETVVIWDSEWSWAPNYDILNYSGIIWCLKVINVFITHTQTIEQTNVFYPLSDHLRKRNKTKHINKLIKRIRSYKHNWFYCIVSTASRTLLDTYRGVSSMIWYVFMKIWSWKHSNNILIE